MKNKPAVVAQRVEMLSSQDQLVMSFITYAELLKGAYGSANPQKALNKIEQITQRISVLYPKLGIAEQYGIWSDKLKREGTPIGGNDLWIASHALAIDAILVTHNVKEFQRITALNWQDWTQ